MWIFSDLNVAATWKITLNYDAIVSKNNLMATNKTLKYIYGQLEGYYFNKLEQFRISLDDIENGRGLNRDFVSNSEIFGANGGIKWICETSRSCFKPS